MMMLRSLGVVSSAYAEDYVCKLDVMTAGSTHGYSLLVASAADVFRLGRMVGKHAVKSWAHLTVAAPVRCKATHRPKVYVGNDYWLQDSVLEVHKVPYNGKVLNWRVEPGNHLVVNGVLTHNCGRGGRDGKHTLCMAYDNKDTVGVRNFLIRMSNPDPSEVEDIYEAMLKNCDTSGRVTVSVDELCKRAGLRVVSRIGAILQILGGSLVIDRKRDDEKRGLVKWLNRVDDPKLQRYMDAARLLGEPEQDGFISVDLISWADHLGVGDASLKSFLRDKTAAHILDYIPPDRAAPIKVIGDKRLINFERIQERQDRALAKFAQVLRYAREIPDKDKHSYIEAMLGMDSNTLGATQPAQ